MNNQSIFWILLTGLCFGHFNIRHKALLQLAILATTLPKNSVGEGQIL